MGSPGSRRLSVLVTNLHLAELGGTETYTYSLTKALAGLGHRVVVLTAVLGRVADRIRELGVTVTDDVEELAGERFDVIHAQHNALAVIARARFPAVPMVFHCHGVRPEPEQPPSVNLNVQKWVAVSEDVAEHLAAAGVPRRRITVLRNPVDVRRFQPTRPLNPTPQRALVLSNRIDDDSLGVLRSACSKLGIQVDTIGRGGQLWEVETRINRSDVVFSLSRGALEAMACGRAVFVYDWLGADGWVTPETIDEIERGNFSGRRFRRKLSVQELVEELRRYDPAMGPANRRLAEERYALDRHVEAVLGTYREAIEAFQERPVRLPGFEMEVLARELRERLRGRESALAARAAGAAQLHTRLARLEVELAQARGHLEAIQENVGYRLLERMYRAVDRAAPTGTRRRSLAQRLVGAVQLILDEGWGEFFRGLRGMRPSVAGPERVAGLPVADEQYRLWLRRHEPDAERLGEIREEAAELSYRPTVSILLAVRDGNPEAVRRSIASVRDQLYEAWELCAVGDASVPADARRAIEALGDEDPRITVAFLHATATLGDRRNEALSLATGDFAAVLDEGDALRPHALFEVVRHLGQSREPDLVYTDEDRQADDGALEAPFFKPDWSPDLELAYNYVGHLTVFRVEVVRALGGFTAGAPDGGLHDLVLRVAEATDRIAHLPLPLYTRGPRSTDVLWGDPDGVAAALVRRGVDADVAEGVREGTLRIRYRISGSPRIAVIIPTRDRLELLRRCVTSIEETTSYRSFEIVVVDNGSRDEETLRYLRSLSGTVLPYPHEFNFSKIVNFAAEWTDADHLVILNNDTEVISAEWLEAMLEHGQRPEVAAVGARLLYPNGRPQHEGILVGAGTGSAANLADSDYFAMGTTARNVSAVTGACMLVRRAVFWELGGFEERLRVAFNDVDFCLRAREKGYLVVYTPHAVLYHHESATRGRLHPREDERLFRRRWGAVRDPYYNPNLDPSRPFRLRT